MMLYCDSKTGGKFWEGHVEGSILIVTFGKKDTPGQSREVERDSPEAAAKELAKAIKAKKKKGYTVDENVGFAEEQDGTSKPAAGTKKRKASAATKTSSSSAAAAKKQKASTTSASSTAAALVKDEDQAAGWCSDPARALSQDEVNSVIAAAGGADPMLGEKALVGKGRRQLIRVGGFLVEWAGARKAKFVSKDAARFEAMVAAANLPALQPLVLLQESGTICRRNTLTRLHGNGSVVQRALRTVEC